MVLKAQYAPMYLPPYHAETDVQRMHALLHKHPLGTWVCPDSQELVANHIPFVFDSHRGPHGTLRAHVSRANPVWQTLTGDTSSLVIFQGPQSYISPSWYPSKLVDGKVVPTWNYTVVHARGIAHAVEDPAWIHQLLIDLTQANESARAQPWNVSDAPADFIERLAKAIVGIEIPITSMVGKSKLSQDEAMPDRMGTVDGLNQQGDANSLALASLVQDRIFEHKQD
jgi:transcriptional regulator